MTSNLDGSWWRLLVVGESVFSHAGYPPDGINEKGSRALLSCEPW
ncbi:hypothetical protein CAter10_3070 [Collimonas arenae]|nr:hypothetical protein CAter10_3070 [Collimonas arenae]